MSKRMKIEVEKTNLESEFDAYILAKSGNGIKASSFREIPFKVRDWVVTHNTIVDDETGEVKEMRCITIRTENNEVVGTNSNTMIDNFIEYVELMQDNNIDLSSREFMIVEGQGKNGKFNSITIL